MNKQQKNKKTKKRPYHKPILMNYGKIKNLVTGGTNLPGDPGIPAGTRHN